MTHAGPVTAYLPQRIVLGIGGGIAAYKAARCSAAHEAGHQVRVVPTESALRFVGAPTWMRCRVPVQHGLFVDVPEVAPRAVGADRDLVLVAPATADLLARAAHGRADDLLCATLLTARCPVLWCPR